LPPLPLPLLPLPLLLSHSLPLPPSRLSLHCRRHCSDVVAFASTYAVIIFVVSVVVIVIAVDFHHSRRRSLSLLPPPPLLIAVNASTKATISAPAVATPPLLSMPSQLLWRHRHRRLHRCCCRLFDEVIRVCRVDKKVISQSGTVL
jgi:hypothetical protein